MFEVRSIQYIRDKEFLRPIVILDAKNIRLATDLTIFDIALAASSGFVHGGRIPFSARGALETGFQEWDTVSRRIHYGCNDSYGDAAINVASRVRSKHV